MWSRLLLLRHANAGGFLHQSAVAGRPRRCLRYCPSPRRRRQGLGQTIELLQHRARKIKAQQPIRNRHLKLDVFDFTPGNTDFRGDNVLEVVTRGLRWLSDRCCNLMNGGVYIPDGRCRIVYQGQQLVVVDDLRIGDIQHVLGPHLEARCQ